MKTKEITPCQQNQALKKQFAELGLDLEPGPGLNRSMCPDTLSRPYPSR
ncbi:hypothetical protein [Phaeodactylibacter xiamenensis]|nr:hypothetical protein [Phaeodactylibacter xiamenensis]